jgi:hypothetical protein
MNQDVYLAEIVPATGGEPALMRLVDDYPYYLAPLSHDALTSKAGTMLRIRRDAECDLPYAKLQIRTAPGDQMAISPAKLNYKPQLSRAPEPDQMVPCYRTVKVK